MLDETGDVHNKGAGIAMRYFEDYAIGEAFVTQGKTVTESDIVFFGAISGDHDPLHMDAEFCKQTIFGQRIAHGLLGVVVQSGLSHDLGLEGTISNRLDEMKWRFVSPIFIGDTVHAELVIVSKNDDGDERCGTIELEYIVRNQREQIVQQGVKRVRVTRMDRKE